MADKVYRYVIGDSTRTKIIGLKYIRASTKSAAFLAAKAQSGLNGTRVVFNDAISRNRLGVQDNAGQMEVIDTGAPAPKAQSLLGQLYDKCRDGTVTGEEMIQAIQFLIGSSK